MKLLATDYDGTLKYAKHIMPEDLQAIQDWKKAGNLFVLCTGRSMESIEAQAKQYDLPADYYITNNGGMVFDREGHELLSYYLDIVTAVDIIYAAKQEEGVASVVINDGVHRHKMTIDESITDRRYPEMQSDMSVDDLINTQKIAQIVISMSEQNLAVTLGENINMFFGEIVVAYANNFVVDVVPKGVSKATGLEFVVEYTNTNEEDVYTIGDSYNDIPLMTYGYHGACMEMADEAVKENASVFYESVGSMIHTILK